jgi:hypothetical protein
MGRLPLHRSTAASPIADSDAAGVAGAPLLWASFSSTASRSMGWFGHRGSVRSSLPERLQNERCPPASRAPAREE